MPSEARKYFGTDGIRGEANVHPMTPELAMRLGQAVAVHFRRHGHRARIVIGKDTRLSGYMFEQAIASGICSMGGEVLLVGPLPTPGIAFITHSIRADAGVVISASHNPYEDNGIKLFAADGFKLPDEAELKIEQLMDSEDLSRKRPGAAGIGRAARIDDARGRYIVHLKAAFEDELSLEGVRVVIDCAHGAAYGVAPLVFEELGARVVAMGIAPNGKNINHEHGALYPESMCRSVVRNHADIGIALDGDADRVIISDEKGQIVDGDKILAMCGLDMHRTGTLKKATVVATVMSNLGLEMVLRDNGITLKRTAVGDRYVVEAMREHGYNVGGEQSGHTVFTDHATTGDGALAALRVLSLMRRAGKPLSELSTVMTAFPQVLKTFPVPRKPPIASLPGYADIVAEAERELAGRGRVLVRYSGTEPKARVMVEGEHDDQINKIADRLQAALVEAIQTAPNGTAPTTGNFDARPATMG